MECELRPRLCFLTKGASGYGFHLHGERTKGGQFIRKVEPGSSAELAGLRAGDRVVEVNGENVEDETHQQVVCLIRAVEHRTRLLVVDRETDEYLRRCGLACTEDLAVETGNLSPRSSVPACPPCPPSPARAPAEALSDTPGSPDGMDEGSPTARAMTDSDTRGPSETESSDADLPTAMVGLCPRLCHLVRGGQGYGFNLHSDKTGRGQFIRSVDPGSPAEYAGLRPLDRLVEVNGVNIEALKHSEVVSFIRGGGDETRLLVVDAEMDKLFKRLGVTPTGAHVKEVNVDEPITDSAPPSPSPTTDPASPNPPIINVTLMGSPIPNGSPKSRTYDSSASQSSRNSTTKSEFSNSVMNTQAAEDDERCVLDPFLISGLRLSPTAAEAKEKVRAKHSKKRAPPMDWTKRQQIFSNL
ncbi:Na(+)/H(+) exchange regulatory cofactor NHE-RF2 [Esox lucius]|uniref:PDZ domain-containing protein n=1 Tax=Esox lucius TaxID=8010 RepID=A0AAY5KW00_ESOLU|nr:Na(+)/H(+) exchange regulatory cofactor NHE-RF2 [Esox lucius]